MRLDIVHANRRMSKRRLERIKWRANWELSRFSSRIRRATVRVSDGAEPRRGVDRQCRVRLAMIGLADIAVQAEADSYEAAAAAALGRARRALGLQLDLLELKRRPGHRATDVDAWRL